MPSFGTASRQRLDTCHPDLIQVCELVIQTYDFTVLEGFRSNARQDELFRQGKSKLRAGMSKHNQDPSWAVDIAPYPIDWEDVRRFYYLQGMIKQAAESLGVKIRQGCDWDGDGSFSDQTFHDLPHIELVGDLG